MATIITKTIKPSGGDYQTFAAWLADNGGATSADLVTNDEALVLEVYEGDYTGIGGAGSGVNILEEDVNINGFTTDATRNITIRAPSGESHGGIIDGGMRISRVSANIGFDINDQYVTIENLQIEHDGNQSYHTAVDFGAGNSTVKNCIIRLTNASPAGKVVDFNVDGSSLINCLVDGGGTTGPAVVGDNYIACYAYNCTVINAAYGFQGPSVNNEAIAIINCVTWNCTKFHDDGVTRYYDSTSGYNASSTYTTQATIDEVGSTSYTSNVVSGDFVNTTGDADFHLASGSNLIDIGYDLSSTFTDDVDGDTRGASWDIGFDEVADVTAPVLSSPTGTATGATTATGSVSTDEGNGTLYYYASTNSSESAATIKASGSSQAVSGTGAQAVSFTGLTGLTTYYAHYVQDDASNNESNVVSSSSFKTGITIGNVFWDAPTGWEYAVYDGGTIPSDSVMFYDTGTDDTSAAAAFLTDSSASWTIDEWVGFRVVNETDGSSGVITANTATTITATLSGGVGNNWDSGDVYSIVIDAAVNDQIVYETTTSLGGTVSAMSTKGVPTITGASGTHQFDVKYRDVTDSKVSSTVTVTVTV